jgi:hypothetical protein
MSSVPSGARSRVDRHSCGVAFEAATDAPGRTAHLVPAAMLELGRHGLTACGFPLDRLKLAAGLAWDEIVAAERCEHCEADSA